jgi:hypothetical protein
MKKGVGRKRRWNDDEERMAYRVHRSLKAWELLSQVDPEGAKKIHETHGKFISDSKRFRGDLPDNTVMASFTDLYERINAQLSTVLLTHLDNIAVDLWSEDVDNKKREYLIKLRDYLASGNYEPAVFVYINDAINKTLGNEKRVDNVSDLMSELHLTAKKLCDEYQSGNYKKSIELLQDLTSQIRRSKFRDADVAVTLAVVLNGLKIEPDMVAKLTEYSKKQGLVGVRTKLYLDLINLESAIKHADIIGEFIGKPKQNVESAKAAASLSRGRLFGPDGFLAKALDRLSRWFNLMPKTKSSATVTQIDGSNKLIQLEQRTVQGGVVEVSKEQRTVQRESDEISNEPVRDAIKEIEAVLASFVLKPNSEKEARDQLEKLKSLASAKEVPGEVWTQILAQLESLRDEITKVDLGPIKDGPVVVGSPIKSQPSLLSMINGDAPKVIKMVEEPDMSNASIASQGMWSTSIKNIVGEIQRCFDGVDQLVQESSSAYLASSKQKYEELKTKFNQLKLKSGSIDDFRELNKELNDFVRSRPEIQENHPKQDGEVKKA